jgi:hypothetical protein
VKIDGKRLDRREELLTACGEWEPAIFGIKDRPLSLVLRN